jgi:hypothetical protein
MLAGVVSLFTSRRLNRLAIGAGVLLGLSVSRNYEK